MKGTDSRRYGRLRTYFFSMKERGNEKQRKTEKRSYTNEYRNRRNRRHITYTDTTADCSYINIYLFTVIQHKTVKYINEWSCIRMMMMFIMNG